METFGGHALEQILSLIWINMADSAYNGFLQTPSFLTNLYNRLLEYSKNTGRNFKNITRERDCLKFDYMKHKFKIELAITFKNGERYKTIILSEIFKKEGEKRLLKRIYLDKKNCIVNL
jgi:hypothetical protein